MLKQQEHPVQTLEVETTPVEQALKDENHNPLDDLPDSPSKCKPSSKPPTISLSPEAAVPSLKSSSSSNTLSSTHQPDAAGVPSSEISSSADASEQTSSCHEEASADVGPYVFVAKERLLGITCCVFVLKSAHHLLQDVGKGRVTAGLVNSFPFIVTR